jgi:ABC-type polysaccharide/polyol phosphate export permease
VSSASNVPTAGFRLTAKPEPLRSLLRRIWQSRDLIRMLARQDFFVRYRRESFGFLWAVGLPLLQAIVLAVVFSRIVKIHTRTSYPVFVFAGMIPWTFFANCVGGASTSIVDGQGLATKIYFPRAVLPLVTVQATFYGFVPSVAVLVAMALVLGVPLGLPLLYLVPGTLLIMLLSASFGLVLSALHVYFRDVRYIVAASMFAWFYATPVLYPLRLAPPFLRRIIEANPASGGVEMFRAAVGSADAGWPTTVIASVSFLVVLLFVAAVVHRRLDRLFVDPL